METTRSGCRQGAWDKTGQDRTERNGSWLCWRQQHCQPPPRASWPSLSSGTEEQRLCPATWTTPQGRTEGMHTATAVPQLWGSHKVPQTSAGLSSSSIQQRTQLRFAVCGRLRACQMISDWLANCLLPGCDVPVCDSLPSRYFSALMFLAATVHREPHHVLCKGGPTHRGLSSVCEYSLLFLYLVLIKRIVSWSCVQWDESDSRCLFQSLGGLENRNDVRNPIWTMNTSEKEKNLLHLYKIQVRHSTTR